MGCTPTLNWKCTDNLTDDERKGTNEMYYDQNYDQKKTFILKHVAKKHCRTKKALRYLVHSYWANKEVKHDDQAVPDAKVTKDKHGRK